MLDTVLRSNYLHLPFADISGKVNERWAQENVEQKSKVDSVEVGDNWNAFYWPSKTPILPGIVNILNLVFSLSFQAPVIFLLTCLV